MHLFNPDNDLALANFGQHYTPPASARKMAEDLALLPIWYAGNENVVAEGGLNQNHLDGLKSIFPMTSSLVSFDEIGYFGDERLKPWGWNPALRKRLLAAGVNESTIPSMTDLERLREYSNRKNAVKMLGELKRLNASFCGESHFFTDLNELGCYLSSFSGDKFLKMPLSGSGKGIIRVIGSITDKQQDWCRRVIQQQGGVVGEPVFGKVLDLALEFKVADRKAQFVAYSLFSSAASGAYIGNELLGEDEIKSRLGEFIDIEILERLKWILENKLSADFPHFIGFLGVDMMICRVANELFSLHPCVEINMRMNMGLVAHRFRERFVHPDSKGIYRIGYFKRDRDALSFVSEMQTKHPLVVENERIQSGFLMLTAVNENTNYLAYATLRKQ